MSDNITFMLSCNDPNIILDQDSNDPSVFHVTYPDYAEEKDIFYSAKIVDENGHTSSIVFSKRIHIYPAPVIDSYVWDNNIQYEQNTYILTVQAHDPNNFNITYALTCENSNVTITQDTNNPNVFHVTYGDFDSITSIMFNLSVTNEKGSNTSVTFTSVIKNYEKPDIITVDWSSDYQFEQETYTVIIYATDPNELELNYSVTCDDPSVIIEQDNEYENRFHATYPDYSTDKVINFTITVTNSVNISSIVEDTVIAHIYRQPTINNIVWNSEIHYEQHSYTMTILATDPQNFDLIYSVSCNDPNVNIEQNLNIPNKFEVTYPDYQIETIVEYHITVRNEVDLESSLDIQKGILLFGTPIIDNVTWNDTDQYEQNSYVMIIDAHDPNNLDLSYQVTCNNSNVTITQDTNDPNVFHVTYGEFSVTSTIIFKIVVSNTNYLSTILNQDIIVKNFESPIINSINWDNDKHWKNQSYVMTIDATDPQGSNLSYQVTCNDSNVIITQDTTDENKFHVTYGEYSGVVEVTYMVSVTNEYSLTTETNVTMTVYGYQPPVINSVSWDDDFHVEQHNYTLTIDAYDPQGFGIFYNLVCNDDTVNIVQDGIYKNKFHIDYQGYGTDTNLTYTVAVTNIESMVTTYPFSITVHAYTAPNINGVSWDNTDQWEQHTYTMTIDATDEYGLDISYQVTCDDSNVTITQDATNENVFHVTYPDYTENTNVIFTITVTNTENLNTTLDDTITVKAHQPPEISSISWDNADQWEQETYVMTIDAVDPNNLDLSYQVTCDDSNVAITQDTTDENKFHVTYPDIENNKSFSFTITVTNTDSLNDTSTDTRSVKAHLPPEITSVVIDPTPMYEQNPYTLTITATDPNNLDLSYQVTCNNSDITITQDATNENVFHIQTGSFDEDTQVIFEIAVSNTDNLVALNDMTETINAYVSPLITDITCSDNEFWEQNSYSYTIEANDPNGLDLTYTMTCSDSDVTITQDTNDPNVFHVTYGDLVADKSFEYNVTVTNTDNLSSQSTRVDTVYAHISPTINNVSWNINDQWEQETYDLTVNAVNPHPSENLTYQLTCDDANVTIEQDTNNENVFHVTYPDYTEDTNVTFTITVTTIDNTDDITTNTKTVKAHLPPVIDDVIWDDEYQWERETYELRVKASDPHSLPLSYTMTTDREEVNITQDEHREDVFHVTYPDYMENTDVTFTITVTNTDELLDTNVITVNVKSDNEYSRGVFGGGYNSSSTTTNSIEYITIITPGNSVDFGDLSQSKDGIEGFSNSTNNRGIFVAGENNSAYYNTIEYITINILGNSSSFGELNNAIKLGSGTSNGINDRGISGGGYSDSVSSSINNISYITISTLGNSKNFGDLTTDRYGLAATSNGVNDRGVFGGGRRFPTNETYLNTIDYIAITTPGDAQDFGDLVVAGRNGLAATSNSTNDRGMFIGGHDENTYYGDMDYITISTPANALVGGSYDELWGPGATSNGINNTGIVFGGEWDGGNLYNVISSFNISNLSDVSDFGEMSSGLKSMGCMSNSR